MARIIGSGYSFDDVLIVPKYNKVVSRKDVSFKTKVTKNYELDMPILAANMDTVCESELAIAIGRLGGLGIIHRFLSIEDQAQQIKEVKKYNNVKDRTTVNEVEIKEIKSDITEIKNTLQREKTA